MGYLKNTIFTGFEDTLGNLAIGFLVVTSAIIFYNVGRGAGIDFMLNLTDSGYICEPITEEF